VRGFFGSHAFSDVKLVMVVFIGLVGRTSCHLSTGYPCFPVWESHDKFPNPFLYCIAAGSSCRVIAASVATVLTASSSSQSSQPESVVAVAATTVFRRSSLQDRQRRRAVIAPSSKPFRFHVTSRRRSRTRVVHRRNGVQDTCDKQLEQISAYIATLASLGGCVYCSYAFILFWGLKVFIFFVAITIYWGVWLLRFHNFVCARGQSRVNTI